MSDHLVCTGRCRRFYFEGCDRMFRVCVLVWQSGWGRRKTERSFVSADFRLLRHKPAAAPGQTPEITVRTGPSRTEPSRDRTHTDGLVSSRRAEPASVTGKNRFIWPTAVYVCVCVCVRERACVCARHSPPVSAVKAPLNVPADKHTGDVQRRPRDLCMTWWYICRVWPSWCVYNAPVMTCHTRTHTAQCVCARVCGLLWADADVTDVCVCVCVHCGTSPAGFCMNDKAAAHTHVPLH